MRTVLALVLIPLLLPAGEKIDTDANWRIRREANEHSEIMRTLHVITDRYGPRLTGSPNHLAAANWAVSQLTKWGLKGAHIETWLFGHPGWLNERAAGYIVAPVKDNLVFEVVAWTPSTKGPAIGSAVQIVPPTEPTKEQLTAFLEAQREKVRGKIVLIGKAAVIPVTINPAPKRLEDADARARFDPVNPRSAFPQRTPPPPGKLSANEINAMIDGMLAASGALVRVNDAGREHGQIRAFNNRTFDLEKAVPTVVLRNEDFGRIERLMADGDDVKLEFNIVNQTYAGQVSVNVTAEIPGTDKADEIVMLGAHFDSWHSATGATDNGIGSAIMMEAARIIETLGKSGKRPRRTIRIALWSGEEQGLLGSKAYVADHFGTFEAPKFEYSKLVSYFNIDSGTGRVRGSSVFGPPEAAAVLREALAAFEDLGVVGAAPTKSRNAGGTDSTVFNAAGLPGIGMGQDGIEYMSHTWHTNLDTYERVIPADAIQAATVIAGAVWHVANRDEMLPRFAKDQMPAAPKPDPER